MLILDSVTAILAGYAFWRSNHWLYQFLFVIGVSLIGMYGIGLILDDPSVYSAHVSTRWIAVSIGIDAFIVSRLIATMRMKRRHRSV